MAIERWFCQINCREQGGTVSAGRPDSLTRDPIMMEESLHGEYRLSLLDRRGDDRRRTGRLPGAVRASALRAFDPLALYGLPLWTSPAVRLSPQTPRRAGARHNAPLSAIRRIVAAIRLWRGRARARQQLRELSDHLLKDIGLSRENVGYEFPKPLWHRD